MAAQIDYSGVWKCSFWYPSNSHDGDDVAEYEMDVYRNDSKLLFQSRPKENGAHMTVNLAVDGPLATGSWFESTSTDSPFEGLIYTGAMQLIISDDGQKMDGLWVGSGREKQDDDSYRHQMYHGRWLLERIADDSVQT